MSERKICKKCKPLTAIDGYPFGGVKLCSKHLAVDELRELLLGVIEDAVDTDPRWQYPEQEPQSVKLARAVLAKASGEAPKRETISMDELLAIFWNAEGLRGYCKIGLRAVLAAAKGKDVIE